MQTVGEKLKQARQEKNLSLEEAYKQTKIHLNVLRALEEDRAHNFLSSVYIKGFIKTYAQYLGLDAAGLFKEYMESQKPEALVQPEVVLENKERRALAVNLLPILRIAAAIVLVFALAYYFRFAAKYISRPKSEKQTPKVKVELIPEAKVQTQDLIVEVRTRDSCWMRVIADEQAIFEKTLAKGRIERWQAKESVELRIGKPEVVDVFLNGKLIDLKKAQAKKGLVITHEGVVGK